MYERGRGVPKNEAEAVAWYRRAAEQGDPYAQCNLGDVYAQGLGVLKDDIVAVAWYRQSAEQGDFGALYKLGKMYTLGRGVTRDFKVAAAWFCKADEHDTEHNPTTLRISYEEGLGVPLDEIIAAYRRAGEQGNLFWQMELAYMYENGWSVPKDIAEALAWFRKAAAQGDEMALEGIYRLSGNQ